MASTSENPVSSGKGITTLELTGAPPNVMEQIQTSQGGQCTVALSVGTCSGLEATASNGGDCSTVNNVTAGDAARTDGAAILPCPTSVPIVASPGQGIATIELAGAPQEVMERIETSQGGQCTVALSAGPCNGLERNGNGGGDRSAVGDGGGSVNTCEGATRGHEAATLPRPKTTAAASPGRRAPAYNDVKKAEVRYSVRVGGARVAHNLDDLSGMYHSVVELRRDFAHSLLNAGLLPADIATDDENFFIGFIRPGHGSKGQKVSVACDDDLTQMYEVCRSRRNNILLWYCLSREAARAYDTYDVYIPRTGKQRRNGSPTSASAEKRRRQPVAGKSTAGSPIATVASAAAAAAGTFIGHPAPYAGHLSPAAGNALRTLTSPPGLAQSNSNLPGHNVSAASRAASLTLHGLMSSSPYEREPTGGSPNLFSPHSRDLSSRHLPFSMFSNAYPLPVASMNADGTPTESPSAPGDGLPWSMHVLKERVEVRKLLIQQLKEWSDLLQAQVIDEEVFRSHKTKILADLERV